MLFDENDDEINAMLAEKNNVSSQNLQLDQSSAGKKTPFTNIRRTVGLRLQTWIRKVQDS